MREHHGQTVPAVWDAIITPDQQEQLRRELDGRTTPSGHGSQVRTYLLGSGIAICGICGSPLTTGIQINRNGEKYRSYICKAGPPRDGCGRITRKADPLEEYVAQVALTLLDTKAVTLAIRRASNDGGREAQLRAEQDAIVARLAGLEDAFGDMAS
jgi:site-specific DNA recombinase